jgi:hypothetical protein
MRKVLLLSVFFINLCAIGQIKVLETKPVEKIGKIGVNDVYAQKEGDEYTFFYKNIEEKEATVFRNFSFKNVDNDFENLYTIITNGMNAPKLQDIKLELPNDFVWLHFTSTPKKVYVQFMTSNKISYSVGISEPLDIEKINKLFGK